MWKRIADDELTLADVPSPVGDWQEIERFALTTHERDAKYVDVADVSTASRHWSLAELRRCTTSSGRGGTGRGCRASVR